MSVVYKPPSLWCFLIAVSNGLRQIRLILKYETSEKKSNLTKCYFLLGHWLPQSQSEHVCERGILSPRDKHLLLFEEDDSTPNNYPENCWSEQI